MGEVSSYFGHQHPIDLFRRLLFLRFSSPIPLCSFSLSLSARGDLPKYPFFVGDSDGVHWDSLLCFVGTMLIVTSSVWRWCVCLLRWRSCSNGSRFVICNFCFFLYAFFVSVSVSNS